MYERFCFIVNRIKERLWVKPLLMCGLSIVAAFLAQMADDVSFMSIHAPDVAPESVETLLTVMSSSMLVIATFSVGSMVTAYASASNTATPRSFPLVIADDVSQNALSAFVGAFIFSIVALVSVQNSAYDKAGRFALFVLTILVFALVIVMFVRWVDRIARLGRLGSTVDKVEAATASALTLRRQAPTLGASAVVGRSDLAADPAAVAIYSESIGYIERIDVPALQELAQKMSIRVEVAALPGTFVAPGRALAYACEQLDGGNGKDKDNPEAFDLSKLAAPFLIGRTRTFDEDPRFGLVVLSEIASRALSPAVNDPGTAIQVIGSFVRLFSLWGESADTGQQPEVKHDLVSMPELSVDDLFEDAFVAIARDGAHNIEVVLRLQKALQALALIGDEPMRSAAIQQGLLTLQRAELALDCDRDLRLARESAGFALTGGSKTP
ncbi:DUF2254 domain-containing protein [Aestuariicella hydrocarbonica]|uniref:DUF2254 domain-containing protein n=1 Tax=Pseudomaricurvus hydrocarbonicus TaxID=1470433 RepID=A0A9E5K0M5_9GAMM|nr:DUF2254 domain-containing protein [Aestuariicella hydrocarbonica]NHO66437.1 DUF2254 domain-containing protein [Aestuariicella hydrocarbonica]